MKRRVPWSLLGSLCFIAAAAAAAGCNSDYPEDTGGGEIRGTLYYDGSVGEDLASPALVVAAFGGSPMEGLPHGTEMFIDPDFPEEGGIPYQLRGLDPYAYTVIGTIIDLENTSADTLPTTVGFYPNFCAPVKVEVKEASPAINIDIHLYGSMGLEDPCITGGLR